MLKRSRFFAASLLLNFLVLSTLVVSSPRPTQACPDEPPKTLLRLYKSSETILVARYSKRERGDLVREDGDYKIVNFKQYYDVSSTLKGVSRKMFVLEEEEYIYKQAEPVAEPVEENSEEYDDSYLVKEGDSVLLFLKKSEDGKKLETVHYRDGVKKIKPESLEAYEKRIRELNSIFNSEKVSDAAIVEWLIRAAEDPLTRWEGTFELLQSFESWDWEKERAKEAENKTEEPAEEESAEGEEMEVVDEDNTVYAKILTEAQKQRLSDILLSRELPANEGDKKGDLIDGDRELIELVKRWGDNRVAVHLLARLRSDAYAPEENGRMMTTVSEIVKDGQLTKISEKYNEIVWEEDDAVVEERNNADIDASLPEPANLEGTQPETTVEPEVEKPLLDSAETEKPKKQTYKELRADLMAKFLEQADKILGNQESAAENGR